MERQPDSAVLKEVQHKDDPLTDLKPSGVCSTELLPN